MTAKSSTVTTIINLSKFDFFCYPLFYQLILLAIDITLSYVYRDLPAIAHLIPKFPCCPHAFYLVDPE